MIYFLVEEGIEVWDYVESSNEMSQQKLASKVVDKRLTFGTLSQRQLQVNEMLDKHQSSAVIISEDMSSSSLLQKRKSLQLLSMFPDNFCMLYLACGNIDILLLCFFFFFVYVVLSFKFSRGCSVIFI